MQSTLLLKKQVEVEKVQEDLDIKRRQFAERMAACKAKEEELKKKQAQVKEKLKPNWAFLLLGEVLTAGLKKISKNLKILVSAMPTFCMPHSQFHTAPNLNINSFPDFFRVGQLTLPKWSVCSYM